MKRGRLIIVLLLGFFVCCLSAQSVKKEQSQEGRAKTLWVVDGVALNDSVFDYSLAQMRSDSSVVLASDALSWVYQPDIASISVKDSIEAAEYGYVNCNGVVEIKTTLRKPIMFIINGIPNITKGYASAGEILGGYDYLQRLVKDEFGDLAEYGIKDAFVIREVFIGCHPPRFPAVIMTTESLYYRNDNLDGRYTGKRGRQSYELELNEDSTYVFTKKDSSKKATSPEIRNYGTWCTSHGNVVLISSQDSAILRPARTVSPDTLRLKIKDTETLSLPKGSRYNKRSVTLHRRHGE